MKNDIELKNESELITYKTALLLDEKKVYVGEWRKDIFADGKPEPHMAHWLCEKKEFIIRPPQSLVQTWLRQKYDLNVNITTVKDCTQKPYHPDLTEDEKADIEKNGVIKYMWDIYSHEDVSDDILYESYEVALEAGIYEALKII